MESLQLLLQGFDVALQPDNLLWAFVGVLLGTVVGILPGIGPALTVALLLPVTYGLEPVSAFIMFAGIYYGGMYGGSTTSILLNTPGESGSIITAIEGNKMARADAGAGYIRPERESDRRRCQQRRLVSQRLRRVPAAR